MTSETTSAGGIVTREVQGGIELLVVERTRDVEPKWAPILRQLPKGRVESGESFETAALREVKEETGCEARIDEFAGIAEWSYWRDCIQWHEVVKYFIMRPVRMYVEHDDEFDVVRWMPLEAALSLLSYPEERALLDQMVSSGKIKARTF